MPSVPKSK